MTQRHGRASRAYVGSVSFPESFEMPTDALYTARVPMALAYSAVLHADQRRKDDLGTPYITHPTAVMALVWHYGLDVPAYADELEDLVIGALLHDVVEDAGGPNRLAQVRDLFGPRVADVVYAATDSMAVDREHKEPWRQRKEQHIARVQQLSAPGPDGIRDAGACLVIACDKLHNLTQTALAVQSSGAGYLERFTGGIDGTRWYYRAMFDALRPALSDQLAGDVQRRLETLGA
jgi:(p)ppGpp synthase/HD superfamily hydrolase